LFVDELDHILQLYLKKIQSNGGLVIARIAMAATRALLLAENRHKLMEYGGHIKLNRYRGYSI